MLRQEEIYKIKYNLGINVTGVGAEPYVAFSAILEKAIEPYLVDFSTTSTTVVVASTSGVATSFNITLASNPPITGLTLQNVAFVVGTTVLVDAGPLQETSQIYFMNGLVASMFLLNSHGQTGAYPIALYGSEQMIRNILQRIDAVEAQMLNVSPLTAGVQKVDEVELVPSARGRHSSKDKFESLLQQRESHRRELASSLGVPYFPDFMSASRGRGLVELY